MLNTTIVDDNEQPIHEKPGAQLAAQRILMDYTAEYVADKLHLRTRIIELLEADDYQHMPEPVFIKGYLRAYAKLLGIPSDPLLATFNRLYSGDRKLEKAALWQSRRESNKAEHAVRWLTTIFAVAVLVAVVMWWQTNKENAHLFPTDLTHAQVTSSNQSETEIRLTDLSKMRSLLSSSEQTTEAETAGG